MAGTLRRIQQMAGFGAAQKRLGISRASLGSLSEVSHVFDPALLRGLFLELAGQAGVHNVQRPRGVPADLTVLAADGTLWKRCHLSVVRDAADLRRVKYASLPDVAMFPSKRTCA